MPVGPLLTPAMTTHHLSMEQRFHLEAAFRDLDSCEDIEKAFAREAMEQIRKEMEATAAKRFGFA